MRRFCVLLMVLVCLLCGCQGAAVRDVTLDGQSYTVDRDQGTITHDGETYQFQINDVTFGKEMEVTYPNGAVYTYRWMIAGETGIGSGGGDSDYDPERYVSGDVLWDVLDEALDVGRVPMSGMEILLVVACFAIGAFDLLWPRACWELSYGWLCKNGEPSDLALKWGRISGGILIILGIVYCLFA